MSILLDVTSFVTCLYLTSSLLNRYFRDVLLDVIQHVVMVTIRGAEPCSLMFDVSLLVRYCVFDDCI